MYVIGSPTDLMPLFGRMAIGQDLPVHHRAQRAWLNALPPSISNRMIMIIDRLFRYWRRRDAVKIRCRKADAGRQAKLSVGSQGGRSLRPDSE